MDLGWRSNLAGRPRGTTARSKAVLGYASLVSSSGLLLWPPVKLSPEVVVINALVLATWLHLPTKLFLMLFAFV